MNIANSLTEAMFDVLRQDANARDELRAILGMDTTPEDDRWLNSDEAAQYLGCPRSRIHDLVQLRRLEPHRDGRRLRFRRSDLDDYLARS